MTTLTGADGDSRRAPTMREVAALAGVSIKTVSRVVNRESGVSPELAHRVTDAMGLLGYRHNLAASNLRRGDQKSRTIGLLLEDVSNPFSSAIYRAIEDVARERDILVLTGSSDEDPVREREMLRVFVSRRVDGLIIIPASWDHNDLLRERSIVGPMVFLDRPATFDRADNVTVDNRSGAREAVRHLAAHGHRHIAFLGDMHSIWTAAERYLGYIEGLATQGIRLDPHLVHQDIHSIEAANSATRGILQQADPPSALFTAQNLITIGAIQALQRLGMQHRVALIGFDDFPLADLLDPGVSVVAQDPATLGRTAANLLFARLDGERSESRHVVIPTRLIARGSGEIPYSPSP